MTEKIIPFPDRKGAVQAARVELEETMTDLTDLEDLIDSRALDPGWRTLADKCVAVLRSRTERLQERVNAPRSCF